MKRVLVAQQKPQGSAMHMTAEYVISSWKAAPKDAAQAMIKKYGQPQEATSMRLVWQDDADEILRYDGSVILNRTAGMMGAICDKEPANFLAINLAHEVASGKRSVEDAPALRRVDHDDDEAGEDERISHRTAVQTTGKRR